MSIKSELPPPYSFTASNMANPSHVLSRFCNCLTRTTGNRTSNVSKVNENQCTVRNPAALPDEIVRQFSLSEIKAATHNFHEGLIIGQDVFGPVYKGLFHDENLAVVVKRFSAASPPRCSEFLTEVLFLCQLRHQHLVSLLGFCNDKDELILVCEYMRNGTLRDHLYDSGFDPLPWKHRLEICIGVARGLHYLHSGAKQAVIHRNIKSANILLDDKWVSKLTDFGLSKMRSRSKSKALEKINSRVVGTVGYLDPEYVVSGNLTEKSDVYLLGAVLLEVLCARKVSDGILEEDHQFNLIDWAHWSISEGTIYNIIDPYLKGRIAPECFRIFVDIARSCTFREGKRRPDMGEVEMMLEHALELQDKAGSDLVHPFAYVEYMYKEESSCASDCAYGCTVASSDVEDDADIISSVASSDVEGDSGTI